MSFQLTVHASETVQKALANMGRTEDIKFSPDNSKLAIAAFHKNKILIIDIAIDASASNKLVNLSDCLTLTSSSLKSPHGLCFFDNSTLGVANRDGEVIILKIPRPDKKKTTHRLSPIQSFGSEQAHRIQTPGSLIATKIGLDLYEMLVCNNYTHKVSRHILDARDNYRALKSEILLSNELKVPDGIAIDATNDWIAISNHETHNVLLFKNDITLDPSSQARGFLDNIKYPHGIRFTADDNFILVADAGTPNIHIYSKNGADWNGRHLPITSIPVIDNQTYLRGNHNPREGGPKGIDITNNMKVFVTTCHQQSLAFFDLEKLLKDHNLSNDLATMSKTKDDSRELQLSRHVLIRELLTDDNKIRHQIADLDAMHTSQIKLIYCSRSWKLTAPLRILESKLRSLKKEWLKFKIERGLH